MKAKSANLFEFRNKTANAAEIILYGPIGEDFFGDGISAKRFQQELKSLGNPRQIDLRIDSPGGSVTDARTIYTLLTEHKATVNVKIDAIAASAASYIAMAGDNIAIAEGGFFMIHEARGVARGTAEDMRRSAELLDTIDNTIADTYVARTGIKKEDIEAWMQAETWFTGAEAVDKGFATELMENKRIAAVAQPEVFKRLPKQLRPNRTRARMIKAKIERMLVQ